MAVVIRLRRTGRKNLPCFRINVTDSRFPRDGRLIETVGVYDPLRKDPEAQLVLKVERIQHWLSVGAKPSEIVTSILKRKGVALPPQKQRAERKRSTKTKTHARRATAKKARATAKLARATERKKQKRAAAKAAEPAAAKA